MLSNCRLFSYITSLLFRGDKKSSYLSVITCMPARISKISRIFSSYNDFHALSVPFKINIKEHIINPRLPPFEYNLY